MELLAPSSAINASSIVSSYSTTARNNIFEFLINEVNAIN